MSQATESPIGGPGEDEAPGEAPVGLLEPFEVVASTDLALLKQRVCLLVHQGYVPYPIQVIGQTTESASHARSRPYYVVPLVQAGFFIRLLRSALTQTT